MLARMLSNIQNIGEKNHFLTVIKDKPLSDGKKPDLTFQTNNQNLKYPPVYLDAKFPAISFQNMQKDQNPSSEKAFFENVKRQVKSLNQKYIAESSTINPTESANFVIMFLPSDAMFYFLMEQQNFSNKISFIQFCFNQKIVPTSPSTIIGFLGTFERYCELFNDIQQNETSLLIIKQFKKKMDEFFSIVNSIIKQQNKLADKIEKLNLVLKTTDKLITKNLPELHELKHLPENSSP